MYTGKELLSAIETFALLGQEALEALSRLHCLLHSPATVTPPHAKASILLMLTFFLVPGDQICYTPASIDPLFAILLYKDSPTCRTVFLFHVILLGSAHIYYRHTRH
jgi:hypothetical protein